jgi:hypothetical protein
MATQQSTIGCIDGARLMELPGLSSGWITSPGILAFCFAPVVTVTVLLGLSGSDPNILLGHLALAIGTFVALLILNSRPLIDPIQAFVFLFHWWFAVGPAVCGTFYFLTGQTERAQPFLTGTPTALLIVAFGLPLYALAASGVLRAWPAEWYASFLRPIGALYCPRTIGVLIAAALACSAVLALGSMFGVRAYEEMNYLGGVMTSSPLMAIIASAGHVSTFAALGLAGYVVRPGQRKRLLLWLMLGISWLPAIYSGSKSPIMLTIFYLAAARFMLCRRLPFLLLLGSLALYLGIVQPFVDTARMLCEIRGAYNSEQRIQIFEEVLTKGEFFPNSWADVSIESPFRGIYQLAQQTADLAGSTEGPWSGESIRQGVQTWIPRALDPDKPDMNIGHFFAVQLAVPSYQSEMHNVSISVPFEIVGNYGWVAGVLSFAFIGAAWTALTVWMLSRERLATHPLMPWLIGIIMTIEGSVGTFVNGNKDLPVALLVVLGVWLSSRHQL